MDVLNELSKDPVIVVRIALAISIARASKSRVEMREKYEKIISELKTDDEVAEYLEEESP